MQQLTEEQKNKLNDLVVGNWAMKDPVQAFAKWAELGRDDVPPILLEALSRWRRNPAGREQTMEWAKNLSPGPARDRFKIQLLGGNGYQQDAELRASLDNPTQRILQMKIVLRRWQETSPKDASDWLAKLPVDDRQALDP